MRCLTLANQLLKQGAEVIFICRHLTPALANLLDQNKISFKKLATSIQPLVNSSQTERYSDWLETSQELDAEATIEAISANKPAWLIVDHYALDHIWETKMKPYSNKIMVIDDLANRTHNCDLLLDQNYYGDDTNPYSNLVDQNCKVLIGPRFALLRPEFQRLRNTIQPKNNKIQRVLIFFGGIDLNDMTSKAIEAISMINENSFVVDVVIGDQHPNKESIVNTCELLGYECYVQTNEMAQLIAQADLCIGAGGSATWERCALGLPCITFILAENQHNLTVQAAKACLTYVPSPSKNLIETIRLHFSALYNNAPLREYISNKAMQFVDGEGALRVAKELKS